MPRPAIQIESDFEIPFSREEIWPILSKTDWINRSLGLPPVTYDIRPRKEGGSSVIAKMKLLGWKLRWQELPFEWLENEFYRVRRIFESGPFLETKLGVDLRPANGARTIVHVYSHIVPRNPLGEWLVRHVIGPKTLRDFGAIIKHLAQHLAGRTQVELPKLPIGSVSEQPLQAGLEKLRAARQPIDLVRRLGDFIRTSPDVEINHIRPLALARAWKSDRWEVLRLFLEATRCGLLNFSWEILCPNCRSTRQPPVPSLAKIERASHCEVCQIKFDAEFDKSVELKFAINSTIRANDNQTFCLAGPGGKPHIASQILLAPGERRASKIPDLARPYRLRSPQIKAPAVLQADDQLPDIYQPVIDCRPDQLEVWLRYGNVGDCAAQVYNPNEFPVQLILERMEWSDDILTAAQVTNWQEFRDLFATEIISPHENVTVGSQIVLFTDLRGSTAMYNEVGDAPAYVLVRNHFYVLTEAIREHHGAIVKTIGDAVMAVFSRVDEAFAAVRQMHEKLPQANPDPDLSARLQLKSSLHLGPCLAVNANDKLDFFGSTINLAARMVGCCKGDDLTISDELYQRPETIEFLKTIKVPAESSEVKFRGFESSHKVWRIQMV